MPRKYTRKAGARRYRDYTEETLLHAVNDYNNGGGSFRTIAKRYNIPYRTLFNKVKRLHIKSCGGQTILSHEEETDIVHNLLTCADYGMPLQTVEVKMFVKFHLDRCQRRVDKFKNNMPADDWISGFMKRHEDLRPRMCQNIKRARAELDPKQVETYFRNLKESLHDVPPENILNYDETNLSNEPGVKKCLFRRGVKYPERIINYSKGNISIMFSGTATGEMLPPYIIYKAQNLWGSWCEGGPPGTRYSTSKSGWMDTKNFTEWFLSVVVPWAKNKTGKKVIIGDNLSSHLNEEVLEQCQHHNIGFVLLPPHSTDKCQPLDVAFFRPMKGVWRTVMEEYKTKRPKSTSLDKQVFPSLLSKIDGKIRNEVQGKSCVWLSGMRNPSIR